jgi:hypothetical protein
MFGSLRKDRVAIADDDLESLPYSSPTLDDIKKRSGCSNADANEEEKFRLIRSAVFSYRGTIMYK